MTSQRLWDWRWLVPSGKLVPSVAFLVAFVRVFCLAEHGAYLCRDSTTNVTIVTGIFPDYEYAPFESPVNPDEFGSYYYNNVECSFDLAAPSGLHVYIEFTSLVLDSSCSGDYVTLALDQGSQRTICGQPGGFIYDIYESNQAHVEFKTDEAVTNAGFKAFFSAYDPLVSKREPSATAADESSMREPEPSGDEPRNPSSRSNAWLLSKRTSTQYLHQYRYANKDKGRAALPLHNATAIREILQTREAVQFRATSTKQKERLERALSVRRSWDKESLRFMRYASSGTDIGRFCGNTCQQTKSDLLRFCRESKGFR